MMIAFTDLLENRILASALFLAQHQVRTLVECSLTSSWLVSIRRNKKDFLSLSELLSISGNVAFSYVLLNFALKRS